MRAAAHVCVWILLVPLIGIVVLGLILLAALLLAERSLRG